MALSRRARDCPCQSFEATAVGNIGEGDPCSLADDRGLLFFFTLIYSPYSSQQVIV